MFKKQTWTMTLPTPYFTGYTGYKVGVLTLEIPFTWFKNSTSFKFKDLFSLMWQQNIFN